MTNKNLMIKCEFGIFYARNKGKGVTYYMNPSSSFMLHYISSDIVRFYSSKKILPVKVYSDLTDVNTIFRENRRKPGIYLNPTPSGMQALSPPEGGSGGFWVNLINGSTYIGSAADLTLRPSPASPLLFL